MAVMVLAVVAILMVDPPGQRHVTNAVIFGAAEG